MQTKARVLAGAMVIVGTVVLTAPVRSPAQANPTPRTKWEYEIFNDQSGDIDRNKIAALGNDGWELIHVEGQFPSSSEPGITRYTPRVYYFKRPK